MILDVIVILLVVLLSCFLCINNKNDKHNCHLTHIVIGLTVIVFYKLVKYYNNKQDKQDKQDNQYNSNLLYKENFTGSVTDAINNFISGDIIPPAEAVTLDSTKLTEYTNKLTALTTAIQEFNNNANANAPSSTPSTSNIDALSLESQQAYQQFQIDYLNKQIKNAQDIINNETIANTSQNYKPIKVFSSCVIAADGSLMMDQPISNNVQGSTPLPSVLNSPSGQQILNTTQQSNSGISNILSTLANNFSITI